MPMKQPPTMPNEVPGNVKPPRKELRKHMDIAAGPPPKNDINDPAPDPRKIVHKPTKDPIEEDPLHENPEGLSDI
jgi:hypothetical protein